MEPTDDSVKTADPKADTEVSPLVQRRNPGSAKGMLWIAPDFDAPLPDKALADWEEESATSNDSQGDANATSKL